MPLSTDTKTKFSGAVWKGLSAGKISINVFFSLQCFDGNSKKQINKITKFSWL